ncbi:MAG TPA: Wzz/FepE/Etk N-terminal domain-containing protein [Pirellulales bacterium]|nr:Wzz/FepE/Etk N-terminal domain-containing protein [Pirellulales bacterium]
MNTDRRREPASNLGIDPRDVLHAVQAHPSRWLIPLLLCTTLGALYAFFKPATWEATQALVVRDEAVGKASRPGRFSAVEEMKTAQETVLELIKSRSVLAAALAQVGPATDQPAPKVWPSDAAIEGLSSAIKITPPKGAEFGKTEVFYLKVQDGDPARAIALTTAVCQQLEKQFDDLRYQKYQGVIDELTKTVSLAQADLDTSTEALTAVERAAGPDLAELRILNETPSNESGLRRQAGEIETELRTYRGSVNSNQELLKLLRAALDDPGRLLASPGRLLESQPALRRLKDGLVDAQLRAAQLLGNMEESHPAVVAARQSEQEISRQLHDEISIAIKGLEVDLGLANERVQRLEEQRDRVQARLIHLAAIRAEYNNLTTSTRHRAEILKTAQQELAEARAGQAAAHTASLITLIGKPDVGSRPVGPGKTVILLGGVMSGLLMGAAIVFLTVMPGASRHSPQTPAGNRDGRFHDPATPTGCGGLNQAGTTLAAEMQPSPAAVAHSSASDAVLAGADCCLPEPGETEQRSFSRLSPIWVAEPIVAPGISQAVRQRAADDLAAETFAALPQAVACPSPAPVAAGSLSLRQALKRVFPDPAAGN